MNYKTKKRLAWILILVPAIYLIGFALYNLFLQNTSSSYITGTLVHFSSFWAIIISVIIWLIGDRILSKT